MNQNKMIIAVLPNAVLLGLLLSSLTSEYFFSIWCVKMVLKMF
jgi:hypothetical protein